MSKASGVAKIAIGLSILSPGDAAEEIARLIEKTILDERERCAKLAETLWLDATDTDWDEGRNTAKRKIAAAIRAG